MFTTESGKGWQRSVKRQLSTFKHGAYQMVYVSGIMSRAERDVSKILTEQGVHDSLKSRLL